jgi:hypothetical protein
LQDAVTIVMKMNNWIFVAKDKFDIAVKDILKVKILK